MNSTLSIPATMQAIRLYEPGGPEQFVAETVSVPALRPGWSLIQVKALGLNHSEVFTRKGLSPSVQFPRILGIECVGVIAATSSDQLHVGQTVTSLMGEMGRDFDGSYAEYVLVPNHQIYPIERDRSWEALAAIPETYYTAYRSLMALRLQARDQILVRAASSGVGLAFLALVKAGYPTCRVEGSVRSQAKADLLVDAGYDALVLDPDGQLETDSRYDKILDLVGPAALDDTLAHLEDGGTVCVTGLLGGQWTVPDFDPIMQLGRPVYLTGCYSGYVSAPQVSELFDYIRTHGVDTTPVRVFPLSQMVQAHTYLASQAGYGKVVVVPDAQLLNHTI